MTEGFASFWLDPEEAESACAKMGDSNLRVQGVGLDEIYFDPATRLKASAA